MDGIAPRSREADCITLLQADERTYSLPSEQSGQLMPDRRKKSTRLTVSLEQQDYDALTVIAAKNDVSLSWVIRQAIHRFVKEHGPHPQLPLNYPRNTGASGSE